MAAISVDLPDCVDASTSEVGLETQEFSSPSPSAAVLETLNALNELFPWWSIRPPMKPTRFNSIPTDSDSQDSRSFLP